MMNTKNTGASGDRNEQRDQADTDKRKNEQNLEPGHQSESAGYSVQNPQSPEGKPSSWQGNGSRNEPANKDQENKIGTAHDEDDKTDRFEDENSSDTDEGEIKDVNQKSPVQNQKR